MRAAPPLVLLLLLATAACWPQLCYGKPVQGDANSTSAGTTTPPPPNAAAAAAEARRRAAWWVALRDHQCDPYFVNITDK